MNTADMNAANETIFLALVPHRDAAFALEQCRRSLFAAGFAGAFAFPAVIPLAVLSSPLDGAELKSAALAIRAAMRNETGAAKFEPRFWGVSGFPHPAAFRLYGAVYAPPEAALPKGAEPFSPAVFPAAVLAPEEAPPELPPETGDDGGLLSFRAAALANVALREAASGEAPYSLVWRMGALSWLPKPGKA